MRGSVKTSRSSLLADENSTGVVYMINSPLYGLGMTTTVDGGSTAEKPAVPTAAPTEDTPSPTDSETHYVARVGAFFVLTDEEDAGELSRKLLDAIRADARVQSASSISSSTVSDDYTSIFPVMPDDDSRDLQ